MNNSINIQLDSSNYNGDNKLFNIGCDLTIPSAYNSNGQGLMVTVLYEGKDHIIICRKLSKRRLIRKIQYWYYINWYAFKFAWK